MNRTEQRNPKTTHLDTMSSSDFFDIMIEENLNSVRAVAAAKPAIEKAIAAAAASIAAGGHLYYVGAGTSGRIAVMDAAECPPTFGVSYDTVSAVIAGGNGAMFRAAEGAEDSADAGRQDMLAKLPTQKDTVIGISASGGANYVAAALSAAKENSAITFALVCNTDSPLEKIADYTIVTPTGEEVLTGSTRLKAGNAQKMVLNIISTGAMVQTGKVCENLMVNLRPTNKKLRDRMVRITCDLTGQEYAKAEQLLENGGWDIRTAVGLSKAEG